MAHYTCGVTASWCGTALGEISEINVVYGDGLPIARGTTAAGSTPSPWSLDVGTIEVSSFSTSGLATAAWGVRGALIFGGTARNELNTSQAVTVGFTTKAVCDSLRFTGKVLDVWRYQGRFRIQKD
jgi:hypothetical protein